MSLRAVLVVLAACLLLPGCFRTQYVNLQPRERVAHHLPDDSESVRSDESLDFAAFGTVPEHHEVVAGVTCGGATHVQRVETGRDGFPSVVAWIPLVSAFYAPWSATVVCDHGDAFARRPRLRTDVLPTEFAVTREYPAPYDLVWRAAITTIASSGWVLARADRETGVLVVPRLELDDTHFHGVPLGHTLGAPHALLRREARLVMSVRPTLGGGAVVDLDVAMRIRIRTGNRDQYVAPRYEWREVRSNLSLETSVLDRIGDEVARLAAEQRRS